MTMFCNTCGERFRLTPALGSYRWACPYEWDGWHPKTYASDATMETAAQVQVVIAGVTTTFIPTITAKSK